MEDPQFVALRGTGDFVSYFKALHQQDGFWARVLEDMDQLQTITGKHGLPVSLIIFPLLKNLGNYPLLDVHSMVVDAAQDRGIKVFDLVEAYRGFSTAGKWQLGRDSLHLTKAGHQYTALAIYQYLQQQSLLLPPASVLPIQAVKVDSDQRMTDFVALLKTKGL